MDQEILSRAREVLRTRNLNGILLTEPASVTWLTGYAAPLLTGPSPFEGGSALAWLDPERVVLVVSDAEQSAAEATGAEVSTYVGYQIEENLDPGHRMQIHLDSFLRSLNPVGNIGVEVDKLSMWLYSTVQQRMNYVAIPSDGLIEPLRIIKTAGEIAKIRAACGLCDTAHATLASQANAMAGQTELAIFHQISSAMEQQAGERLPILCDLIAGARTANIGGLPGRNVIQPGDPLLADIVPRLNGYWGDSCNVYFAGSPSPELHKMYTDVRDALHAAISAIKPGMTANQLDRITRDWLTLDGYAPYPHHTGHGIGVTYHEQPRICAYNEMTLEPGMVIALEPGVYVEGVGGVRLEHALLVTADGCESLTQHTMEL